MIRAIRSPGVFPILLQIRQDNRHENRDDPDGDQKLDQRKSLRPPGHGSPRKNCARSSRSAATACLSCSSVSRCPLKSLSTSGGLVRLGRRNQVDLRQLEKVLVRPAGIVDDQTDASPRQDDIAHQADPVPLRIDGELQRAVSLLG